MAVGGLLHGQGSFGGAPLDAIPPTGAKLGASRAILVDAAGGPLSVAVAGANVHDTKLLRPTLESIVAAHPEGTQNLCLDNLCLDNLCLDNLCLDNLCLDKGYDNPTGHGTVAAFQYCPHIRRIGEEKLDRWGEQTFPARRWVVERTLGWRSKRRAILAPYARRHPATWAYVGLILRGPHPTWASSYVGLILRGPHPTWASSSWPAPCSGTAVSTDYCFEIVSKCIRRISYTIMPYKTGIRLLGSAGNPDKSLSGQASSITTTV